MKDALSIHRLLLEHQTTHEIVRLPHSITSGDELPVVLGLPADRCLCTRLYTPRSPDADRLAAAIVTAGTWPPLSAMAGVLDVVAVRPAPADLVNRATGYAAELVAPLLLATEITMLVDRRAAGIDDIVYTTTGEVRTALGIRAFDLFSLCDATCVSLTAS